MDLTGLIAVAFLDKYERFAKTEEDVAIVRLFYGDASALDADSPNWRPRTDLTWVEYKALTLEERTTIQNAGSAAGFIDTEHKSNA